MFLSVFCPKAEQNIPTFLRHLPNKLLASFSGCHTIQHSKLALLVKLQQTTAPLVPQLLDAALNFLLDDGEAGVRASPLTARAEAASAHAGKRLADAAATCFCLNTSHSRARLLLIYTSVSWDMVRAVFKRFKECFKTFQLMDFDESFIMDDRAQSAVGNWTLQQLEKSPEVKLSLHTVTHLCFTHRVEGQTENKLRLINCVPGSRGLYFWRGEGIQANAITANLYLIVLIPDKRAKRSRKECVPSSVECGET